MQNFKFDSLLLPMMLPILAALVSYVLRKHGKMQKFTIMLISISLFLMMLKICFDYVAGDVLAIDVFTFSEKMKISFETEKQGVIFALLVSFLWILVSLYSFSYLDQDVEKELEYAFPGRKTAVFQRIVRLNRIKTQSRFFVFLSISIFATIAVAFSANLFTMFIFYEILTISTYPLVAHHSTEHAKKAGRKYLMILMSTSMLLFLPALIIVTCLEPSAQFVNGGIFEAALNSNNADFNRIIISISLILFTFGIAKSAIFPFHSWLPAAMVAPAPVSALLHAVAVVKTGIFCISKILVNIFGFSVLKEICQDMVNLILIFIVFTVIYSSFMAIWQNSLKKMLAFSTISQLGLCLFAIFLLGNQSVDVLMMQMISHAFAKIILFLCAGNIYLKLKIVEIEETKGLFSKMPITAICMAVAALSIIGMPVGGGAVSKMAIIKMAWQQQNGQIFVIFMLLSSFLTAYYFFPMLKNIFFEESEMVMSSKSWGAMEFSIVIASIMLVLLVFFLEYFIVRIPF